MVSYFIGANGCKHGQLRLFQGSRLQVSQMYDKIFTCQRMRGGNFARTTAKLSRNNMIHVSRCTILSVNENLSKKTISPCSKKISSYQRRRGRKTAPQLDMLDVICQLFYILRRKFYFIVAQLNFKFIINYSHNFGDLNQTVSMLN